MTVVSPQEALLSTERALCAHYRAELKALLALAAPDSEVAAALRDLDRAFSHGYSDLLVDRFEALAREATDSTGRRALSYLRQTETGEALGRRAAQELERAQGVIRGLSDQLAAREAPAERLRLASALREALGDHRAAWRAAASHGVVDEAEAPGQAMLGALARSIAEVEDSARARSDRPLAPRTALASLDVGRLLAQSGVAINDNIHESLQRVAASLADGGAPASGAWSASDGALSELMRARIERASDTGGAGSSAADLAALDAAMREAARLHGSSYGARLAAEHLEGVRARDQRGAGGLEAQEGGEVAELARRRAELYQRRIESSDARGAALQAMERRHAALVREAEGLEAALGAGATPGRGRVEALAAGLRGDQGGSGGAEDAALGEAAERAAALGRRAGVESLDVALESTRRGAEAGLRSSQEALGRAEAASVGAAGDRPDTRAIAQDSARDSARRVSSELTSRLMSRTRSRPLSALPAMGSTRVLVEGEEAAPGFEAAFEGEGARRPGESMWGQVNRRLARGSSEGPQAARRGAAPGPDMARLGRLIEQGAQSIGVQVAQASAAAPQSGGSLGFAPAGAAALATPRLAGMPGRIHADLSSARMRGLYMPILARMTSRTPGAPRAMADQEPLLKANDHRRKELVEGLANPQSLFAALLGDVGQRLIEEKPEVADRLQASLKPIAGLLPTVGEDALKVVQKYTERMRRTVETWFGSGSEEGVERGRNEPVLTEGGGAARTAGDYIGGPFAIDVHGAGESTGDLVRGQADRIERKLQMERRTVDTTLLDKVSKMVGKKPTRQVESFAGPVSSEIAREMGAKAFTIGSTMFLPGNSDQALKAHEMVHAIDANDDAHPRKIEDEERVAYGVQGIVAEGEKSMDRAMQAAMDRMDLAKERNIPAMRLPNEPGGASGTADPDPGRRQSNPKDQAVKEEQVIEAIADAVESMLSFEANLDQERFGNGY